MGGRRGVRYELVKLSTKGVPIPIGSRWSRWSGRRVGGFRIQFSYVIRSRTGCLHSTDRRSPAWVPLTPRASFGNRSCVLRAFTALRPLQQVRSQAQEASQSRARLHAVGEPHFTFPGLRHDLLALTYRECRVLQVLAEDGPLTAFDCRHCRPHEPLFENAHTAGRALIHEIPPAYQIKPVEQRKLIMEGEQHVLKTGVFRLSAA